MKKENKKQSLKEQKFDDNSKRSLNTFLKLIIFFILSVFLIYYFYLSLFFVLKDFFDGLLWPLYDLYEFKKGIPVIIFVINALAPVIVSTFVYIIGLKIVYSILFTNNKKIKQEEQNKSSSIISWAIFLSVVTAPFIYIGNLFWVFSQIKN